MILKLSGATLRRGCGIASVGAGGGPNSAVTHATEGGTGCSRNVASVISASVPCDPASSLPMS